MRKTLVKKLQEFVDPMIGKTLKDAGIIVSYSPPDPVDGGVVCSIDIEKQLKNQLGGPPEKWIIDWNLVEHPEFHQPREEAKILRLKINAVYKILPEKKQKKLKVSMWNQKIYKRVDD